SEARGARDPLPRPPKRRPASRKTQNPPPPRGPANGVGPPPGQEAATSSRHEGERELEEPRKRQHDCENRQCNQGDLDWMRGVDRLELHQLSDRILPLCRLPEEDDRDARTSGRGRKLGEAQEAAFRLRELHGGPEPTADYADAVSGRQRASREHALRQETPGQQRRRQRGGKK